MKIIIAKRSGRNDIAYINASKINSFHVDSYDGRVITKIYLSEGKCEIEGDRTKEMAEFMSNEGDCGILDLVNAEYGDNSFWKWYDKHYMNNGGNNNADE